MRGDKMVFEVMLKLRENEVSSTRLLGILSACASPAGVKVLSGGGGYLHGYLDAADDYLVSFCFQKNDEKTGALIDVTETDREQVGRALDLHPLVESFLIGPLLDDHAPDNEPEMVRRFRAGERGCGIETKSGA
jgi:hypothetical protein